MKTNLNLNEIDVDLTFLFHEKKDNCNNCIYWHEPFKESNEELPCCEKDTEKSKAYLLGYENKCSDKRRYR